MIVTDLIIKRQQAHERKLGSLTLEYFQIQKRIEMLEKEIVEAHTAIAECEQSRRDYVTCVAVETARGKKPNSEAEKES